MNNNTILNNRWKNTDKKLKEYLKVYKKISSRTQDSIQDIFNSISYSFLDLTKPISTVQRKKLLRVIEEWEESNLLTGYFKYKVDELLRKRYITNEEMLDILLWGAYVKERSQLDEYEKVLFTEIGQDLYNQGVKEIKPKKKKKWSLTWEYIWFLLALPNARGNKWITYIEALGLTNAQEIKRQAMIHLQQKRKLDIYDNVFQNTIKKQQNKYLSINGDKYSGALENQVIDIGNTALLKAGEDYDANRVRFIAEMDSRTTRMCQSLNNQIFSVSGRNKFKRYSAEAGAMVEYDIYGLLKGINLPPIDDHYHYCRSTITYQWEDIKMADKLEHKQLRKSLNSRIPKSFEEFEKMKYNSSDWYDSTLREKVTINTIKTNKDYSNKYKQKMIKTYYDFRKRDVEMTAHALNRFLGQKQTKVRFTEKELIDVMNNKANYYEADTMKDIKYYNKLAVIQDKDNKEVITIVRRNIAKEEWEKYE